MRAVRVVYFPLIWFYYALSLANKTDGRRESSSSVYFFRPCSSQLLVTRWYGCLLDSLPFFMVSAVRLQKYWPTFDSFINSMCPHNFCWHYSCVFKVAATVQYCTVRYWIHNSISTQGDTKANFSLPWLTVCITGKHRRHCGSSGPVVVNKFSVAGHHFRRPSRRHRGLLSQVLPVRFLELVVVRL